MVDIVDSDWGTDGKDAPDLWVEWDVKETSPEDVPLEMFEEWEDENDVDDQTSQQQRMPATNEAKDDDNNGVAGVLGVQEEVATSGKNSKVMNTTVKQGSTSCEKLGTRK